MNIYLLNSDTSIDHAFSTSLLLQSTGFGKLQEIFSAGLNRCVKIDGMKEYKNVY